MAQEARRGRFLRLAWPHLTLLALYLVTLGYTLFKRLMLIPDAGLVLTAEAVWGMVGFATLAIALAGGGIVAAWQARSTPSDAAWDLLNMEPEL